MEVSVVIPTFNRRHLLRKALDALGRQETDSLLSFEVLVCDDGSNDGTGAMCEELAKGYPVNLRFLPGKHSGGPSTPRNEGTAAALGKIVLFVDDDVEPAPDLVLRHAVFHREHSADHIAAVGRLVIPQQERDDAMVIFSDFPYDELAQLERPTYLFFWTGNISLKRDFMLAKGMFRPDPSLYPIEDMDCGHRLFKGGLDLRYLGDAVGYHYPTVKPERVADRGRRTGMAQIALWKLIGDPAILIRFGVLATEIGMGMYLKRAAKRIVFRIVDQPLTHALLRALGAASGKRSRWSDVYYYLIFRRHMIAGNDLAWKRFANGEAPAPVPVPCLHRTESHS